MFHRVVTGITLATLALVAAPAAAQQRPAPESALQWRLPQPVVVEGAEAERLAQAPAPTESRRPVVVRLTESPVAIVAAQKLGAVEERAQRARVRQQQERFLGRRGLRAHAAVQAALNAVIVDVDAAQLASLRADPEVASVKPVTDYELHLVDTVPYIGARAVQSLGFTGDGVRVAVLDSGVDYTHAAFGGSGNVADYAANNPTIVEPGTFPTPKVVGGFDFVGNGWPSVPLAPDPDPLDDGPGGGHGTHVADIIGGALGVAPGVDLYAVKVCSSVSTACSGIALIQGMDFAVDPNGDGDTSDHVDIVNMSLGSPYGQPFDDDLSFAVANATKVGVLTVASAGNSSDKPYVTGSPGASASALSVAETQVPSAELTLLQITSPAAIAGFYNAVFQPWSAPLTSAIAAPVQYGDGTNKLGCDPFAPGALAGTIVLVDRGACSFSIKIANIGDAGGLAGVIGLVAPGDPFEGAFGGGNPTVPGFMISQGDANRIKSQLGVGVSAVLDPSSNLSLTQHMVGGSSRGPGAQRSGLVKPEIGAPGASVSAIYGTGTGTGPFGGTSGAAPMVAGSAALLMEAYPDRTPTQVKATLMSTAEPAVMNKPALFGGTLAPITRIGGGEVRVDRALGSGSAASGTSSGAVSFGEMDVPRDAYKLQELRVFNFGTHPVQYNVSSSFRFGADAASGAVQVLVPASITVPAGKSRKFTVDLRVKAASLPDWGMDSGSNGANGDALTAQEFDGFVELEGSDGSVLHVPWQVLPRKASDVSFTTGTNTMAFQNWGAGTAFVEAYSLIGKSGNLSRGAAGEESPTPDLRYVGHATYDGTGACPGNSPVLAFAFHTWERQTHLNAPASLRVRFDVNRDGTDDYELRSADFSLNSLTDGRNLSWVVDLATSAATAFFYSSHETNSRNTVLLLCGSQIGVGFGSTAPMDIKVQAVDAYFGGPGDEVAGITIAPFGHRFLATFDSTAFDFGIIPGGGTDKATVTSTGSTTNTTETGVLLLYRGGAPRNNEAAIFQPGKP